MASTEEFIQKIVVSFEAGVVARWIRVAALVSFILAVSVYFLVHEFQGIAAPQAMDQAQIGRELLRGHGFTTQFFRPLAAWQLQSHGHNVVTDIRKETYNAPLPAVLDAAAMFIPLKKGWGIDRHENVSPIDRCIAAADVLFFLLSVGVLYFIALELFDRTLANLACGLVLICDAFWDYAISGLPQMLLLFLFHLTCYVLIRAFRAKYSGHSVLPWLAGAGLGFGLLALTHALTIWIFAPALLYTFVSFRPRPWAGGIMLAVFLLVYGPWLLRTYLACGSPFGMAIYGLFDGVGRSEAGHMRMSSLDLSEISITGLALLYKKNLLLQLGHLMELLGWNVVAPVALVSFFHFFKKAATANFRWILLFMWLGAWAGVTVFGLKEDHGIAANQIHLLFVPLFICYGLAYLIVQWERRVALAVSSTESPRRRGPHKVLRFAFLTFLFFLSGLPLLSRFCLSQKWWGYGAPHYPPYAPNYIAILHKWVDPETMVASDVPWAVAWYADRPSVWIPSKQQTLYDMSDYKALGLSVGAIYLTPVSGTENTLGDLISGEYAAWTAYIVRTVNPNNGPFPWRTPLGAPECMLYAPRNPGPPPLN